MAAVDTTKGTARASVKLTGDAREALVAINARHGVPVSRLVALAVQAGLPSVIARYKTPQA